MRLQAVQARVADWARCTSTSCWFNVQYRLVQRSAIVTEPVIVDGRGETFGVIDRVTSYMNRGWSAPSYQVDVHGKVIGAECRDVPNNWGRWGELDERGTANFIDAACVLRAASLIKTGTTFSLAVPIERGGPVHPERADIVHLYAYTGADCVLGGALDEKFPHFQGSDDYIFMPLQGSTQWDALAHSAHDDLLYNGWWAGNVESYGGARRCSIHQLRDTLVGRGILLDVARLRGVERLQPGYAVTDRDLDECARIEGVQISRGDILLIRTGHLGWYYQLTDKSQFWASGAPGLGKASLNWLHEHEVAAVALDNVGGEVEPFEPPYDMIYPLHVRLIRDLGLTLGEVWWLDDIADACWKDKIYDFFLCAPPLYVSKASGSPLNPLAIK